MMTHITSKVIFVFSYCGVHVCHLLWYVLAREPNGKIRVRNYQQHAVGQRLASSVSVQVSVFFSAVCSVVRPVERPIYNAEDAGR